MTAAAAIGNIVASRNLHVVLAGDFDARSVVSSVRFRAGRQALGNLNVNYQPAWELTHPYRHGSAFHLESPR